MPALLLDKLVRPVALRAKERTAEQETERRPREVGDEVGASLATAQLGIDVPAYKPCGEQPCRDREAAIEHDEPTGSNSFAPGVRCGQLPWAKAAVTLSGRIRCRLESARRAVPRGERRSPTALLGRMLRQLRVSGTVRPRFFAEYGRSAGHLVLWSCLEQVRVELGHLRAGAMENLMREAGNRAHHPVDD